MHYHLSSITKGVVTALTVPKTVNQKSQWALAINMRRDRLEAKAEEAVRATLADAAIMTRMLATLDERPRRQQELLYELDKEDARWLEAFRLRAIEAAELGEYRREIKERRAALQSQTQGLTYPVQRYAEAAWRAPFGDLLEAARLVLVASPDYEIHVTIE